MLVFTAMLALAAPLQPGDAVSRTFQVVDGPEVVVPDPDGRIVVLELLRSPDW